MKKLFVAMLIAVSAMAITVADAEAARRLGGGGSFGRQSPNVTRQVPPAQAPHQSTAPSQANQPRPAPGVTPQVPPRPASPWRGILGGALLGLGLGALLSHFGIGGAFASAIGTLLTVALVVLAIMFLVRLLRRKTPNDGYSQPAYAGNYGGASRTPEIGSRLEPQARPAAFQIDQPAMSSAADSSSWTIPADLDVPAFLRNAKTYFIRLQAAWDKADIIDLREFTTPEMYAELKLQLHERGMSPNVTDVVSLDAELLGVETVKDEYVASVKFTGLIKEGDGMPAEPFAEVWNLVKPASRPGGWVLAGIQQLSEAR